MACSCKETDTKKKTYGTATYGVTVFTITIESECKEKKPSEGEDAGDMISLLEEVNACQSNIGDADEAATCTLIYVISFTILSQSAKDTRKWSVTKFQAGQESFGVSIISKNAGSANSEIIYTECDEDCSKSKNGAVTISDEKGNLIRTVSRFKICECGPGDF